MRHMFYSYKGFKMGTVRLVIDYNFPGFLIKIEKNMREMRYDIFMCKNHKESGEEINIKEVERFQKFYGKGFNIIL